MKGLVLAGGRGTRLRPLTYTRAKQLIPIANKPALEYGIEDLVDAGVTDIGIVISPETGDEVRRALGDGSRLGAQFQYILQESPDGLAHAVKVSRGFLGDDPFVMYLGDNLLSGGIRHLVEEFTAEGRDAILLLTRVDEPHRFGVAVLDEQGRVVRLVEKPKEPPSDLALVGVYLFSPAVHEVIEGLRPSWRGELEITEAIQGLIERGRDVVAHLTQGWWKDTGKPEDLLDANRLVLSQLQREVRGEAVGSELVGQVRLDEGSCVERSVVRGPVHVASGARVVDSYLGPYTAIGPGAVVERSEVEYSILMHGCVVRDLPHRLDASVIGQGAVVASDEDGPRRHTLRVVLGDGSQVLL